MKNKLFYAEYHVTEYISDTCTLKQLDYLQLFYGKTNNISLQCDQQLNGHGS